jgi:hypothetical protein
LTISARLVAAGMVCAAVLAAEPASGDPERIVDQYAAAASAQQSRLNGASMEVDIQARLPKLQKQGRLVALRHISNLGRITYDALRFEGDRTVKTSVITRYLTAESDAQSTRQPSLKVTPENYKFKYKGVVSEEGRQAYLFQVTPRAKRVGLFKGELLIDAETYLPVRESGRFIKNPSIFLKKIEFVRKYEVRDGVAFPKSIETVVDTRLVGKAELNIAFSHFSLEDRTHLAGSISEAMPVGRGQ